MKKTVLFLALQVAMIGLFAQNFEQYFQDQTLRIDYRHVGNSTTEKIEVEQYYVGGHWDGTWSNLIEKNRIGDILFEVFDGISGKKIYSRSYSCLFYEYRTTERGPKPM